MDSPTGTETRRTEAVVELRELIRSPPPPPPPPRDIGRNSLRPFSTAQKPTCGFCFTQDTDHRRRHNDLQLCDPSKWRSTQ